MDEPDDRSDVSFFQPSTPPPELPHQPGKLFSITRMGRRWVIVKFMLGEGRPDIPSVTLNILFVRKLRLPAQVEKQVRCCCPSPQNRASLKRIRKDHIARHAANCMDRCLFGRSCGYRRHQRHCRPHWRRPGHHLVHWYVVPFQRKGGHHPHPLVFAGRYYFRFSYPSICSYQRRRSGSSPVRIT